MKRFIIRFVFGCVAALLVLILMVGVRVLLAWPAFSEAHTIPEGNAFLFVGDSHIGCSIDNGLDGTCHIVWSSSSAPWHAMMRMKEMERNGTLRRVKYCVTELGYQTFYGSCREIALDNNLRVGFPLYWRGLSTLLRVAPWTALKTLPELLAAEFAPTEPFREEVAPFVTRDEIVRMDTLREALSYHTDTATMPMTPDKAMAWHYDAYREMNRICEANGVRFVVFSAPVTQFYRDVIPDSLRNRMAEAVSWLEHEGIPYIDCMAVMPEDDFRDATHLLPSAARRFTPRLLEQIRGMSESVPIAAVP